MTDKTADITGDLRCGILWTTFQRPQARYALSFDVHQRLGRAVPGKGC